LFYLDKIGGGNNTKSLSLRLATLTNIYTLRQKLPILGLVSGIALVTLGTASAVQAAIVTVPTGLNPGDQYRLVFVTSGTRDATSTNIADYNTFVANAVVGSALQSSEQKNSYPQKTGFFKKPVF
jgi:hypothetical protein